MQMSELDAVQYLSMGLLLFVNNRSELARAHPVDDPWPRWRSAWPTHLFGPTTTTKPVVAANSCNIVCYNYYSTPNIGLARVNNDNVNVQAFASTLAATMQGSSLFEITPLASCISSVGFSLTWDQIELFYLDRSWKMSLLLTRKGRDDATVRGRRNYVRDVSFIAQCDVTQTFHYNNNAIVDRGLQCHDRGNFGGYTTCGTSCLSLLLLR